MGDQGGGGQNGWEDLETPSDLHPAQLTYWLETTCREGGSGRFDHIFLSLPQVLLVALVFSLYESLPLWLPLRWLIFRPRLRVERTSMRCCCMLLVLTAGLFGLSAWGYAHRLGLDPRDFAVPCNLLLLGPLPLFYPPLLVSYLTLKALWARILLSDSVVDHKEQSIYDRRRKRHFGLFVLVQAARLAYMTVQCTLHLLLLLSRVFAVALYGLSLLVSLFLCEFYFFVFWLLLQPGVPGHDWSRLPDPEIAERERIAQTRQAATVPTERRVQNFIQRLQNQRITPSFHADIFEALLQNNDGPAQPIVSRDPEPGEKVKRKQERLQRKDLFGGPSFRTIMMSSRSGRLNLLQSITLALHNTLFSVLLLPPVRQRWKWSYEAIILDGWGGLRFFNWWQSSLWRVPDAAKLQDTPFSVSDWWLYPEQSALHGLMLVLVVYGVVQVLCCVWAVKLRCVPDKGRNGRSSKAEREDTVLHQYLMEHLCLDVAEIISEYDDRAPPAQPKREFLVSDVKGLTAALRRDRAMAWPSNPRFADVVCSVL
eukprot:gb/GEZN01003998.1/.p1 GENE.gb/GEZN01003998.1/~~gb/GEZN01003998.1/.p1  ORF type:complete len:539 (+),score=82.05 gb/GEZN01003998.1/:50-1666(+)